MNFWERITGSDLTRDWQAFEARAAALPDDYRQAWEQVRTHLVPRGDFTGRNLTPIVDGVLGLLETTAADGQSVAEALGDDIPGFCAAVAGEEGAKDYRDRWREQLNRNVARKLSRLGG
jgi:DNA-binding ferritin-like protein (Dps family)